MAPLPPPPPPAPPPPPMGGPPVSSPPKLSKGEAMDRNALLSQIRGGAKLKKNKVINDRSAPALDGKSSNTSSGPGSKGPSGGFSSSGSGGPSGLGGLFAGGVPKLKPTGSKLVSNGLTVSANKLNNNCTKTDESVRPTPPSNTSSIKTSLEGKFQQNNSSFLHSKTVLQNSGYGLSVANNSNKFHTMKAREKPSYVLSEGKGQAPQVPTQTSMSANNRSNAPELPRKPPAVQRSNSQSSGRSGALAGRPRPGPPNMKPPPPPKTTSAPPSQTSTVTRRQSFTDDSKVNLTDNWNGRPDISALVSNFNQQGVRPAAPPKNINPIVNGMSQSPAYPPPPPPVSTIPTRSNSSAVRMPSQMKSNAPNIPTQAPKMAPPVRPPIGPPPPPPHRTTSNNTNNNFPLPPPPSQTKVIPTAFRNGGPAPAPPPPIRNTSMSRDQTPCDFSSRFAQFKAIFELPAPTPMTQSNKVYPSHMQQSQRRRDPPPPPPQSNGMASHSANTNAHNSNLKKSNPVLHIQIGSTVAQS